MEAPEQLYFNDDLAEEKWNDAIWSLHADNDVEKPEPYIRKQTMTDWFEEWILNNFQCEGYGFPLYFKGVSYMPANIVSKFKRDFKKRFEK